MNVTESVCIPAESLVPNEGVYTNVPVTEAVALRIEVVNKAPYVMDCGVVQAVPEVAVVMFAVVVG